MNRFVQWEIAQVALQKMIYLTQILTNEKCNFVVSKKVATNSYKYLYNMKSTEMPFWIVPNEMPFIWALIEPNWTKTDRVISI